VPKSVDDLPPFEDYSMKGRTYKYMEKEPLFPFGFGLSYSTFEYSDLNTKAGENDDITVSVNLKNSGNIDAEEVAQIYISSPLAGNSDPLYSLIAFKRVSLPAGKSETLKFNLDKNSFLMVDENGQKVLRKSDYKIWVGGSLPGERSEKLGASVASVALINPSEL